MSQPPFPPPYPRQRRDKGASVERVPASPDRGSARGCARSDSFAADFEALRCHVERLEYVLMAQFPEQFASAEIPPIRAAKIARSGHPTHAVDGASEPIGRLARPR